MTGIGETTLVKQVYNDPRIVNEFQTRLFVHISPMYNRFADIQLLVLNQLDVIHYEKLLYKNCDYLDHQLSEALSFKNYLTVLDDVWIGIINLQDNGKGSRFIIISHIQSLGRSVLNTDVFLLPLMKDDQNNLRGKLFEEWKTLFENKDPLVVTRDDETPLSKARYFSYMMLPQYLKALFMYMVLPLHFRLLKKLDSLAIRLYEFPHQILSFIHLSIPEQLESVEMLELDDCSPSF
ncbi:hypothetical protein MIMGU_mgv1a022847mg, partial [Erythranthe guttata]